MIDKVYKSGIEDAKTSKAFDQLKEINNRYQVAIKPYNVSGNQYLKTVTVKA